MNCRLFETIINDLERSAVIDARARAGALAHSEACGRCAARLGDERMLTAGLRRVAAAEQAKEAPPRVEFALRAAFRQQQSHRPAPVINRSRSRWGRWAIATAATILILLTLAALRLDRPPSTPVENARQVEPDPAPGRTEPGQTPHGQTSPAPGRAALAALASQGIRGRQVAGSFKQRPARRDPLRGIDGGGVKPPQTGGSEATEIATEFMPLVQGDNLNSMEGGQIVRVELPRSALISFGLPMNMERANERIKADVVFGNDGLARAIRFVR